MRSILANCNPRGFEVCTETEIRRPVPKRAETAARAPFGLILQLAKSGSGCRKWLLIGIASTRSLLQPILTPPVQRRVGQVVSASARGPLQSALRGLKSARARARAFCRHPENRAETAARASLRPVAGFTCCPHHSCSPGAVLVTMGITAPPYLSPTSRSFIVCEKLPAAPGATVSQENLSTGRN